MEKKRINKKEFIEWLFIILSGILINALCVLLFSCSAKAESPNPLPYIVANENISGYNDMWYIINIYNPWEDLGYFKTRYNNGDDFFGYDYYEGGYHCWAIYFPNENFDYSFTLSEDYEDFDMTSNSCQMTFSNVSYFKGYFSGIAFYGSLVTWNDATSHNVRFFNGSNKGDGNTLVPNISTSNYLYDDDEYQVVFGFGNPERPIIPTGHATQPINNPDNIINGLDGNRIPKPTAPTINNYSWTTYTNPTIDTSTIETLLESIFNTLSYNFSYLFTNLGGLFTNLISNIVNEFNFVVDSIYYVSNNIVSAIQDFATDFYNNMVSLFESIAETIQAINNKIEEVADLFINPFDEEEFEEQMENSDFLNAYNELMDNADDIRAILNNAEERDHFSLYISFENPLATTNHRIIQSEISFDWLVPLRSVYRPFLWVCTLIELFVGGARVLTHALGGDGI